MFHEADIKVLWKELDDYNTELDREAKTLEDVWLKIAQLKSKNDSEIQEIISKEEFNFLPEETVIVLNVGGQVFETNVSILTKDPYSLLAACCRVKPPLEKNPDGLFFFDRDWWLFRHILNFLKSQKLPNDLDTLKELYREASFYRLEKLQLAIENLPVDEIRNISLEQATLAHTGLDQLLPHSPHL